MSSSIKPQRHLINILSNTSEHHPNFTIFLGAGASVTSNVLPATKLIEKWRETYKEMYENNEDEESLLEKQHWYNKPSEYSVLFELLYDHPSQRREFIESCIERARPSWGYIYLVNLLKNSHFNTIFTTNFDDLVNEACYTFSSNLRPIVCAHDSSINSVRLTSERPKIIKLHGDFLFDNIKNTIRELESLEDNMRSKFKQYASEFGMIFVGYAGNDRSIMDTLNTLLHSNENFPHGIYWCVMKGTKFESLSEQLKALSRFPKFKIVEIDGFDEFFAEVHDELNCTLQQEVSDPYNALVSKLDKIFQKDYEDKSDDDEPKKISSGQRIIRNDYKRLMNQLARTSSATKIHQDVIATLNSFGEENLKKLKDSFEKIDIDQEDFFDGINELMQILNESKGRPLMPVPNSLLAHKYYEDKEYEFSISYALEAMKEDKRLNTIHIAILSMINSKNYENFDVLYKTCKSIVAKQSDFSQILAAAVDLMKEREYSKAEDLLMLINKIPLNSRNRSYLVLNIVLVKVLAKGEISESLKSELIDCLTEAVQGGDEWAALGLCILGDHLNLLEDATFIIDDTSTELLTAFDKSHDLPIRSLLSEELNAKIKSRLQESSPKNVLPISKND